MDNFGKTHLHAGVSDELCSEIVNEILAPGSVLTLEDIARRFGVSRTVAREVTQSLESMRLVVSRRRVGSTVQPQSSWNVLDRRIIAARLAGAGRDDQLRSLTELRIGVEPLAAAGAAHEMDGRSIAELEEIAKAMRAHGIAGDQEAFIALDNKMHELILKGSGNELFSALSETVLAAISGRSHIGMMPQHPKPEAMDFHVEVAQAIARRDAAGAEAMMRSLLEEVRNTLGSERDTGLPAQLAN